MSDEPLEAIEAMMAEHKTSWLGRITDPDGTVRVFDDPKAFAEASGTFRYDEINGHSILSQGEAEGEGVDPLDYAEKWASLASQLKPPSGNPE